MDKIVIKFKEAIRVNASFYLKFDDETGKLQLLAGKDSEVLSEVDLPTEKIITNAFYDDTTKELVIDFESANQVRIPIDFTDEIEKAVSDFENKVNEQFSQFQESFNEEIDNLSQEISNIEQTINENINQQIENLSGEINALEETINESVNQNIESLNSKIDILEEEINTNINSQVETLNQKVDTLEDTINNNIGKQVESLNESINETKQDLNSYKETNDKNVNDIKEDLQKQISDNLDSLNQVNENLSNSKVDKVEGKQLSTIDLTNELLTLLQDKYNKEQTDKLVNELDVNLQKQIDDIKLILTTDDVDFDTLQELVNALKNNVASINDIFSTLSKKADTTYVEAELLKKVDKVEGKGLSTNDYTTEEKNKLSNLENYDDTELREEIDTKIGDINSILDTLNGVVV